MQDEVTVREICDADVDHIIALWQAAGITRPWNDPATDIAFTRRNPHSTILVADDAGTVVATAMVGEDGHRGWYYYVATLPERQGQGLGRRIMAAAEAWLLDRGVWKAQLLVRRDNEDVVRFYDHLGYRDTQTRCLQKIIAPDGQPAPAGATHEPGE